MTAQGRQTPVMEDLTPTRQEQLRLRVAHLLEAETGFRRGDPRQALPGEPHPAYDPAITTLGQRRRAKVAELGRLGRDEARMLGLEQVSERTLERLAAAYQRFGIIGCVDGRWLRRGGGHPSVSEELREAIDAVHAETLHRSKVSMRTRERLIQRPGRSKGYSSEPGLSCLARRQLRHLLCLSYCRGRSPRSGGSSGRCAVPRRPGNRTDQLASSEALR